MGCRAHGDVVPEYFVPLYLPEMEHLLLILAVSRAMHSSLSVVLLSLLCPKANAELDLQRVRTATVVETIRRESA